MSIFLPYPYTDGQLSDRVNQLILKDYSSDQNQEALRLILAAIDLTTLEATDTDEKVKALCNQAMSFSSRNKGVPNVAAVCVYPPFVSLVREQLRGSNIQVASVATAFPSGQTALAVKEKEVSFIIEEGADEVDMVISRGKFLEGKYDQVKEEIECIKQLCGKAHLKVILETGELESVKNIRKASEIALLAGADFLKTSTGKIQPAASPGAFLIMLDTIKEYYHSTGKKVGIKAAGGIADTKTALVYFKLTEAVLGKTWLNKDLFRIGASRLAENVFRELS
jgi:deoxyribose-phosphate aldolase